MAEPMPLRIRLAEALHEAANLPEYNLSQRMMSVHGGPHDSSYLDAADMILDTQAMQSLRDDLALAGHERHGQVLVERDAMERRADAAEADWQEALDDLRLIGAWWNGIGRVYQSGSKASGAQHERWEAAVPALERAAQAATGEGSGLAPSELGGTDG